MRLETGAKDADRDFSLASLSTKSAPPRLSSVTPARSPTCAPGADPRLTSLPHPSTPDSRNGHSPSCSPTRDLPHRAPTAGIENWTPALVSHYDPKQALIDGPSTGVPRQAFTYRRLVLTPYVLKKLPRSAGSSKVKQVWDASDVEAKWAKSAWCQKRQAQEKRRNTTDFERFEVMLLKKQRRRLVQVRYPIHPSGTSLLINLARAAR